MRLSFVMPTIAAGYLYALLVMPMPCAAAEGLAESIAPQLLVRALDAFAVKTGLQLVYRPQIAAGLNSKGARAGESVENTLRELLRDTGLTFEFVNERTVTIQATGAVARGAAVEEHAGQMTQALPGMPIALAQVPQTGVEEQAKELPRPTPAGRRDGERGVPEILVKGRRTSNTDIRRSEDDVQPYVVFDAEQIERSMASNLGDFLKTRLPMNATAGTAAQDEFPFGTQSEVDLRGLGSNQTLILVNGRRMPGVSVVPLASTTIQPDINGIPMETVERIEVLPSTASGIYGGGATGGVVNIVLKRDYSGIEVKGSYDNSFDSDAGQRRLGMSAGFHLRGGATSLLFSGSYSDANPLLVQDRDFTRKGRELYARNNAADIQAGQILFFSATPNIQSLNGMNLALDNGTVDGMSIGSRITFVPPGYPGVDSDGGAALAANAGQVNLALPDDVRGARHSLLNRPVTESLSANLRHELTDRVEVFADLSMFNNNSRGITGFGSFRQILPGNAPNNPFVGTIAVTYPSTNVAFETRVDSEAQQAAGGLLLRLPGRWTAQTDYGWSRSRFRYSSTAPVISNAGDAAIANGTLDIVRDLNLYPLELEPYLLPSPNDIDGPADSVLHDLSLRLAGPVFDLPGGALTLSALLEYRDEEAENSFSDQLDFATDEPTTLFFPHRGQKVKSAYLEATAPLVAAVNARPFLHELQLQASVRHDEYETETVPVGGSPVPSRDGPLPTNIERVTNTVASTDYTFGARYAPAESLALRVSYGTGFLAPSIAQLFPLRFDVDLAFVSDPKRSGFTEVLFPIFGIYGGNADLAPEESRSWSAGAIFTPRFLRGLRLSIDYTRIEKTDEITSLTPQDIVNNEDVLPGRVVRADLTQDDMDAGYTGGEILGIDQTLLNIARSEIEAYDFQVDYGWQTAVGAFNVYVLATHQPQFRRQTLPGTADNNLVGFTGGVLDWRGNGGLTLTSGPWTVGWNAQYYHSYLVYTATDSDLQRQGKTRLQGNDTIPSQMYHDVFVKYRFGGAAAGFARGLLADSEIAFGVANVFDESPPVLATSAATGGYSPYADPRLRRYSISLRRAF